MKKGVQPTPPAAEELITLIRDSRKRTPVRITLQGDIENIPFPPCKVFRAGPMAIVYGEWEELQPVLAQYRAAITDMEIEQDRRLSAIPLLDLLSLEARVEPGAIIRDQVTIAPRVIVMMGAVINIGASIGEETMIDMNAVIGGRAQIGQRCHVGAGAVIAGVIEPPSAVPVCLGDDVVVGANAVIIEGVQVGKGAVVAAGAVVLEDVPPGAVVGGVPARVLKLRDQQTQDKTQIVRALRELE